MDSVPEGAIILIVEDEPTIADLFKTLMEMEGFRPRVVTRSSAGINYLRSNIPDAILLDVMLPGESGLEVARFARQDPRLKDVPIIIVSARTQEDDLAAGEEAGADVYLKKPISNRELIDTVHAQLGDRLSETAAGERPRESLEVGVERSVNEVERYLAEINRSLDAYESAVGRLERGNGTSLSETQTRAREVAESCRRQIRSNQAAGWRVLERLMDQLELKELAVQRRGSHEPMGAKGWQAAAARAQFVREDCRAWARHNPTQILREYESALVDGDRVYAYLLERYGQRALEEEDDWERLAGLQERIRARNVPDGREMETLETLYDRINPLRARLAAVRLPDALLLVQRKARADDGRSGKRNGHPVPTEVAVENSGKR